MRKFTRYALIMTAVAAIAAVMSGCVIIKSNSSTQLSSVGDVQITTTFCASDTNSNNSGYNPPDSDCQGPGKGGNSNADASNAGAGSLQLLIAYRIPTKAAAPGTITTTNPGGGGAITFTQSSSYTTELQSLSSAPSGQKWVGYTSDATGYSTAGNQYFTVAPSFTLQQEGDGSPFTGPFSYRVIVGHRRVDGSNPATRPVDCGSSITTMFNDGAGEVICVDSPSAASIPNNLTQPTQDLGILDAPGAESVNQGKVARLNFPVEYAGDGNPAPTFTLEATTDIPDAEAVPSTPILTPEEGTTPLRVIVRPPVNTPTGIYAVTLIASLPSGEVRSSTHEVLVTPTTVRCNQAAPTIAGTRGDDILVGTPRRDVIAGYAGDDTILALEGNDLACAGKGDDEVRGGNGNDRLAGRRGNDLLSGGRGRNVIKPGPGRDRFIQ